MEEFVQTVIRFNFVPISILVILIFFVYFNDAYEHDLSIRFSIPIIFSIGLIICETIDYYFIVNEYDGFAHLFINFLEYNCRIMTMLASVFLSLRKSNYKYKLLITVPFCFNFIVLFIGFFTDKVFYLENGHIMRGHWGYFPILTCFIYALLLIFIAAYKFGHNKKMEAVFIWIIVSLIVLSVTVEVIFNLRGILTSLICLCTFSYYLFFHIEHFKYDALTDALNRSSYDAFILKHKNKVKTVFSIDMNDLKLINDTKGHLSGDKALIATARAIRRSLPANCNFYRTGGDEFIVLVLSSKVDPDIISKDIDKNVKENGCSVAIGYCRIVGIETLESAFKVADDIMYRNKRIFKNSKKEGL